MPLSEQEQRLLDEMERGLYHSEADDVTTVGPRGRANYRAIVIGVLAGLVGIALLVVGVVMRQPLIGLGGFVIMFGGALFAITPPRRFTVSPEQAASRPASEGRRSFMDQVNDRWERRSDDEQR
jgi:hypothetical protein